MVNREPKKKVWGKTGNWKSQTKGLEQEVAKSDRRIERVRAEIDILEPEQFLRKEMLEQRLEGIVAEAEQLRKKLEEYRTKGNAPVGPLNPDLPTATGQGLGDGYGGS